jgi:branched-chain amino acid transport system ATP-binding protein
VSLEVDALTVGYGIVPAVRSLSFVLPRGGSLAILGANGAGKSTTLNCLGGLLVPLNGKIVWEGRSIAGLPAHDIAQQGIALVPEGRRLFAYHSVKENLELGAYSLLRRGEHDKFRKGMEFAIELFPIIGQRLGQLAGSLSGGEQQMVAIARALVRQPRLLLLDEPSLGLDPRATAEVMAALHRLGRSGVSFVLSEQKATVALAITDLAIVLAGGRATACRRSSDLASDPRLIQVYLGMSPKPA